MFWVGECCEDYTGSAAQHKSSTLQVFCKSCGGSGIKNTVFPLCDTGAAPASLLLSGLRLLNEPEQHSGAHEAPRSPIRPGAFLCLLIPSAAANAAPFLPPSFPSVKNLYFISELWSSSAQLSADKAQEALERRHGYLEEGRGVARKAGRQAGGQAGTQPPRGTTLSPRYFFRLSPSLTTPPPTPLP